MEKAGLLAVAGLFGIFGMSVAAIADDTVQVVSVDTDAYAGTEYLDVERGSSGELTGLVYRRIDGPPLAYTLDQLRQKPQLLKRMNGHDVTFLRLESDFSASNGGHANVRFLNDGVTGNYKNFRIGIEVQGMQLVLRSDPNPNDGDSDGNAYTSVFNHLFMKKRTFLGAMVGVDRVIPDEQ